MKIDFKEYRLIYILLATIILFSLFALTSCQSIDIEPSENGIVCAEIEVAGFFTNSRASYRYIEAGESVVLTEELVNSLCPGF
jgi:hypothetical protein